MDSLMEKQILFVDDEKCILDVLAALFRPYGYRPRCSMNGNEALEIVKHDHVRVCFVDLRMPAMDGMELCRQIKRIEPSASVYALSAFVDAHTPDEYREAGFDGYFSKPFRIAPLREAAHTAFEKARKRDEQPSNE